jgi:hypothetical protein
MSILTRKRPAANAYFSDASTYTLLRCSLMIGPIQICKKLELIYFA